MKNTFLLLCAVAGVLATCAEAQPAHRTPSNTQKMPADKPAPGESKVDFFWRKSDEAYEVGDYERAIRFHQRIVALDPRDVESFGVAAWLMWSLGQNEKALEHIARGLKVNPKNWQMWRTAGQQYDLQKPKMPQLKTKAKIAFQRAVEFLPANADKNEAKLLRRSLAHAAQKADDLELSVATWRKLVADFPDDEINKRNLERVEKLLAEKNKTAVSPLIFGGAGIATIAILGGVLRLRAGLAVKNQKSRDALGIL